MFSTRAFSLGLPIAALLSFAAFPAAAQTYDAAKDFSVASNPNGVWSYGYEDTLGSTLNLYTDVFTTATTPDIKGWNKNISLDVPFVIKNFGSTTNSQFADIVLQPGQLAFHPGPQNQLSVVRFTAPQTSTYLLSSKFSPATSDGTTTDVHVYKIGVNKVALFAGSVSGTVTSPSATQYSTDDLELRQGDTVDFAVGYGSNGNFYQDATALDATLTVAPEPSQVAPFAFLAMGLGAMIVLKKKKATTAA